MFSEELMSIANALLSHCNNGTEADALSTLYAPDAVSAEAAEFGDMPRETKGIDAIKAKHDWWFGTFEVNEQTIEGPFFHGESQFGLTFAIKTTNKETGQKDEMKELAIYTVENGKIVREDFFNTAG